MRRRPAYGRAARVSTSDLHRTSSVVLLRSLGAHAEKVGLGAGELLRAIGLSSALLEELDARVPDEKVQRAWTELARATDDQALGVRFAERAAEGEFEVLDYAVYFSSTLGDAIERIARFYRLLSDSLAIRIVRDGREVRIVRLVAGTDPHEQDAFFATVCARMRVLTGGPLAPSKVRFEHPPHAVQELEGFFRSPVHFGCAKSELVFAASDLERAARNARPKLAELLDRYAASTLLERIRDVLGSGALA
ncbi:MAG: AraC family transcriptional regulator [Sorangiineae bacterium PRO1]|nr:AraC family transcriptional regulator [Sorangiineae bacterium PRO1]